MADICIFVIKLYVCNMMKFRKIQRIDERCQNGNFLFGNLEENHHSFFIIDYPIIITDICVKEHLWFTLDGLPALDPNRLCRKECTFPSPATMRSPMMIFQASISISGYAADRYPPISFG